MSVVGRSLAYLCLHQAELNDADIGTKGRFLAALGLDRKDIAAILDTTEETVRVMMRGTKGGSKGGKKTTGQRKKKK